MVEGWVLAQKKVFTRWSNIYLGLRNLKIEEIENDFKDGLLLANLLEVLSGKNVLVSKCSKLKNRVHLINNINYSLKFIGDEGIRLVGCGAEDINDSNLKLTMGLIWTLIKHYQIQSITNNQSLNSSTNGSSPFKQPSKQSANEAMLNWTRETLKDYSNINITDIVTSFKDGIAFCSLVHKLIPEAIDISNLKADQAEFNLQLAFDTARKELNIPSILEARDVIEQPDELCIMTYLSLFPKVYQKFNDPNISNKRFSVSWLTPPTSISQSNSNSSGSLISKSNSSSSNSLISSQDSSSNLSEYLNNSVDIASDVSSSDEKSDSSFKSKQQQEKQQEKEKNDEVNRLSQQLKNLVNEFNNDKEKEIQSNEQLNQQQNDIILNQLRKIITDSKDRVESLQVEFDVKSKELEKENQEILDMRKELDSLRDFKSNCQCSTLVIVLKERITELETQINEKETIHMEALNKAESELEEAQSRFNQLISDINVERGQSKELIENMEKQHSETSKQLSIEIDQKNQQLSEKDDMAANYSKSIDSLQSEKQELLDEKQELLDEKTKFLNTIQEMKQEIEKINAEKQSIQDKSSESLLNLSEGSSKQLSEERLIFIDQMENLKKEKDQVISKLQEQLNEQYSIMESKASDIQKEKDLWSTDKQSISDELSHLKEQVVSLETQLVEKTNHIKQHLDEKEKWLQHNQEHSHGISKKDEEINKLLKDIEMMETRFSNQTNQRIQELILELDSRNKKAVESETYLKSLENELAGQAEKVKSLTEQVDSLDKQNSLLESVQLDYEKLKSTFAEMEKSLGESKLQLNEKENTISALKYDEKEKNKSVLLNHEKELEDKMNMVTNLKKQLDQRDGSINEKLKEINESLEKRKELEKVIVEQEETIISLRNQLETSFGSLKDENTKYQQTFESGIQQFANIADTMTTVTKRFEENQEMVSAKYSNLEQQLEDVKLKYKQLKEKHQTSNLTRNQLEQELAALKESYQLELQNNQTVKSRNDVVSADKQDQDQDPIEGMVMEQIRNHSYPHLQKVYKLANKQYLVNSKVVKIVNEKNNLYALYGDNEKVELDSLLIGPPESKSSNWGWIIGGIVVLAISIGIFRYPLQKTNYS